MSIPIHSQPEKVKAAKYIRAKRNLEQLVHDLPQEQRAFLEGNDIALFLSEKEGSTYKRGLSLQVTDFSPFDYSKNNPSQNQRWAASKLKQCVVDYLANKTGFCFQPVWHIAVRKDRSSKQSEMDTLFQEQRYFDSSDNKRDFFPSEYNEGATMLDTFFRVASADMLSMTKWLVDILLVRDYLVNQKKSAEDVESTMSRVFPKTYPLAKEFEENIKQEAAVYTSLREGKKTHTPTRTPPHRS